MATLAQLQATGQRQAADLEAIQAELSARRETLTRQAASDKSNVRDMQATAAAITVLEARERATRVAMERNAAEQAEKRELTGSKEYKQAAKRAREIEAQLSADAKQARRDMEAMRERVQKALETQQEYMQTVKALEMDADSAARDGFLYLAQVLHVLTLEHNRVRHIETVDRQNAERAAAKKNPKPKPQAEPGKPGNYWHSRYTNHDGTPITA